MSKQRWLWLCGSLFVLTLLSLSLMPPVSATSIDAYNWTVPTRTPIPGPTTPPPTQDPNPQPTQNPNPQPTATTAIPQPPTATPYASPTATIGASPTVTPDGGTVAPTATGVAETPTTEGTPMPTEVGDSSPTATVAENTQSPDVTATATPGELVMADATVTASPIEQAEFLPTPTLSVGSESKTSSPGSSVMPIPANAIWLFLGGAVIFALGAVALGAWWKLQS